MHTKNIRTCNFNHGFFNSQQSSLNICDFCLEFQELGFREPTELIKFPTIFVNFLEKRFGKFLSEGSRN